MSVKTVRDNPRELSQCQK